jgi:hypothetical protein
MVSCLEFRIDSKDQITFDAIDMTNSIASTLEDGSCCNVINVS